jgi:hypothetical protein
MGWGWGGVCAFRACPVSLGYDSGLKRGNTALCFDVPVSHGWHPLELLLLLLLLLLCEQGPSAQSLHDFSVHFLTVPSIVTRLARVFGFVQNICRGVHVRERARACNHVFARVLCAACLWTCIHPVACAHRLP